MAVCNSHKHRAHVGELALQDLQMNKTLKLEYRENACRYLAIPESLLLDNSHLSDLVYTNQKVGVRMIWNNHKILIEDSHSNIDLIVLMLAEAEWLEYEDIIVRYP